MDEFKPEDELKPDTSDRRPQRSRKSSSLSLPKVAVSRQHVMIGTGVLVLVLLVLGIGSALKSPDHSSDQAASQPVSGGEKNIDLSGSASMSGQPQPDAVAQNSPTDQNQSAPQELNIPQIASSPTDAQPVPVPDNQQRVELPGDLNNALSSQQGNVDAASQAGMGQQATANTRVPVSHPAPVVHHNTTQQSKPVVHKPVVNKPTAQASTTGKPVVKESKPAVTARHSPGPVVHAPATNTPASHHTAVSGSRYTLQLSSASRSDTLNAWAKKQNLSHYRVYQTTRNGQPWYVLVSGSYNTTAEAKQAIASLPAAVQAQKPWIKPVSQVQKEAGK